MTDLTPQTLVIAIQAVAARVRALREAVAAGQAQPQELALLEDHLRAAGELELAYDFAALTVLNLPPYEELTGD
ncbi:hypothetical protein [Azohydromonas aeria]|uniref:hypothetical protein n=1 Tax=Azohydromonas aeria TaxID=2590212 RepID=UPI0012F8C7CF|nr:hypothetical protein [Azohydromonas aeria]